MLRWLLGKATPAPMAPCLPHLKGTVTSNLQTPKLGSSTSHRSSQSHVLQKAWTR